MSNSTGSYPDGRSPGGQDDSDDARVQAGLDAFERACREGKQPDIESFLAAFDEPVTGRLRRVLAGRGNLQAINEDLGRQHHSPASSGMPTKIGRFAIEGEIGRGAMGVVYRATHPDLKQVIAIKTLLSTENTSNRDRFLVEARAAASLHHPNIIPVMELGEDAGRPYYVMKFVGGPTLETVIERRRSHLESRATTGNKELNDSSPPGRSVIPIPDASHAGVTPLGRLINSESPGEWVQFVATLGKNVADAISHAHDQEVVHRDIKPSNIILEDSGKVWVADFGLAKASSDQNLTTAGTLLGTLRYVPAEVINGDPIDILRDIYALGLTLYETLALRPAFDAKDENQLVQQIKHGRRPRLGELNPAVPRDLETIVHKAMDVDASARYEKADDLKADLSCFLNEQPIKARRRTLSERLGRWARRNPATAVLVALVFMSITSGAGLATAFGLRARARSIEADIAKTDAEQAADRERLAKEEQARLRIEAETAKNNANSERNDANDVLDRLTAQALNLAKSPHAQEESRRILHMCLDFHKRRASRTSTTPDDEQRRGIAFRQVGDIESALGSPVGPANETGPETPNKGELAYMAAIAIFRRLTGEPDNNELAREALARSLNNFGNLLHALGRLQEAEERLTEAMNLHKQLTDDYPSHPIHKRETASSWNNIATVRKKRGDLGAPRRAYDNAIDIQQAADFPEDAASRREVANTFANRATLLEALGDLDQAERDFGEAVRRQEALAQNDGAEPKDRRDLAATLNNLANLLEKTGRSEEAQVTGKRSYEVQERLVRDFDTVPQYRLEFARSCLNLGRLCFEAGCLPESENSYRRGLRETNVLVTAFPSDPAYALELARLLDNQAHLFARTARGDLARDNYCQARCVLTGLTKAHPDVPEYAHELARNHVNWGLLEANSGRLKEADEEYKQAIVLYGKLSPEVGNLAECHHEIAILLMNRATALKDMGDIKAAEAANVAAMTHADELVRRFKKVPAYRYTSAMIRQNQGVVLGGLMKLDLAASMLHGAVEDLLGLTREFGKVAAYRQLRGKACDNYGNALRKVGQAGAARAAYDEAVKIHEAMAAAFPRVPEYRWDLARALLNRSTLPGDMRGSAETARSLESAYRLMTELIAGGSAGPDHRLDLARVQAARAESVAIRQLTAGPILSSAFGTLSRAAFDQAVQSLAKLAQEFPDRPEFEVELATIYAGAHTQRAARARAEVDDFFEKGIRIHSALAARYPGTTAHQFNLAMAWTNRGAFVSETAHSKAEIEKEEECYEHAIRLLRGLVNKIGLAGDYHDRLAAVLHNRGWLCVRTNRMDEAGRDFAEAIALREAVEAQYLTDASFRANLHGSVAQLAALSLRMGKRDRARELFNKERQLLEREIKFNPNDPKPLNHAAWFLVTCPDERIRDMPTAVRLAQKAVATTKGLNGEYQNTLGVAQYRADQFDAAVEALNASLRLQGPNPYDYFFLAMARWQQGRKDEARAHFQMAVRLMKEATPDPDLGTFRTEATRLLGEAD